MPVRPIVRLGHPALRAPALPITPARLAEPFVQELIEDMIETMREASGIGLAAPQLGVGMQIFVYRRPTSMREPGAVVLVDPCVILLPGEPIYDWEGCLSIPGLLGLVPRSPRVRVKGSDRQGRPLDYVVAGPEARVVQHEFDHLRGRVFLDRMDDLNTLRFESDGPPARGLSHS